MLISHLRFAISDYLYIDSDIGALKCVLHVTHRALYNIIKRAV